jgi:hypothetical protein
MSYFFLVPGLICLFLVISDPDRGVDKAFLSVYLPTLFLLPWDYTLRVPHLPELSVSQICVIPLGVVAVFRFVRKSSFVLMDFLVPAFLISLTISEVLYEKVTKDGILLAIASFISLFMPYAIGRTMIEPGNRLVVVRRIVLLVLLLGAPGFFEWRMGRNLYAPIGNVFGVSMSPTIQLRDGHGRLAAAFQDAEVAGTAIAMAFALNAWLAFLWRTRPNPLLIAGAPAVDEEVVLAAGKERRHGIHMDGEPRIRAFADAGAQVETRSAVLAPARPGRDPDALFDFLGKYHIAEILLVVYIFLTQSRGPELALIAGYLVLQILRFKKMKVATAVVGIVLALAAAGAYQYFSEQTNVTDLNAIHNEQQGSALYRRQMLELFKPIVERGGWLGWGYMSFPHAQGLGNLGNGVQSIDNQFLYVQLGQGKLGLILFVLIAVESVRMPFMRSWRLLSLDDRAFAVCMLAALVMLWINMLTVYMGSQLPQVSYLLIGWAQSIVASSQQVASEEPATRPEFFFRRVFT